MPNRYERQGENLKPCFWLKIEKIIVFWNTITKKHQHPNPKDVFKDAVNKKWYQKPFIVFKLS